MTFWWNTGAPNIAGFSSGASTSDFLLLQSGAVVGPASVWSTTNNPGSAAWRTTANGHLRFNCWTLPSPPASAICYGYVHMSSTAPTGFPATFLDYAYDNSGAAIAIPQSRQQLIDLNGPANGVVSYCSTVWHASAAGAYLSDVAAVRPSDVFAAILCTCA
ncbi:MAG: hypothetical protein ABIY56_09920 [Dokdonella sp.]